jgi:transcriptional regulator with XRE-family HTH domain
MQDIYKNIRRLRIQNNMSQAELADAIGYTDRSSIAKIEKKGKAISLYLYYI